MKRQSAAEVAKQYNLDLSDISSRINLIHELADVIERHLTILSGDFAKIGTNIPGFSTDIKLLTMQVRDVVRKVNKYCNSDDTENFGNDCDFIFEQLENFRKNEKSENCEK